MAHTVPFVSQSALFVAGMTAQYRPLRTLVDFAKADTSLPKARRERILETFLREFDGLPQMAANDTTDLEKVWHTAQPSCYDLRAAKRGQWCQKVVARYDDEVENLFARRCAAMLIELYVNVIVAPSRHMSLG